MPTNTVITTLSEMSQMPKENLIFDMGLHEGEDSDFYLRKGFNVVAFEANPALAEHCKKRFVNHIAAGRLRIIEGAIAPRSVGPSVKFYRNSNSVWGTVDPEWAMRNDNLGSASEILSVTRVDIAEVFQSIGIPFYLKIDLEGVDGLVLEELSEFEDRPQYLSVETEKTDLNALHEGMNVLVRLGYKKFKIVQQATLPGSTGSFRSLDGNSFSYTFPEHSSGAFGEEISQPWISFAEALKEYEVIFRRYRWFGDTSMFPRLPPRIGRLASRLVTGHPFALPGWHDIHASL
jgi:FkbM family methyltransferase